jgi:hypothetical protein
MKDMDTGRAQTFADYQYLEWLGLTEPDEAAAGINENSQAGQAATPPRPRILPPDVDEIPDELRAIPAWVGWRQVWVDGKDGKPGRWTKEPVNIRTGGLAESDNPATWVDFKTAAANYQRLNCDGIGLCLTDDWVGTDLDGVLDDDGKLRDDPRGPR